MLLARVHNLDLWDLNVTLIHALKKTTPCDGDLQVEYNLGLVWFFQSRLCWPIEAQSLDSEPGEIKLDCSFTETMDLSFTFLEVCSSSTIPPNCCGGRKLLYQQCLLDKKNQCVHWRSKIFFPRFHKTLYIEDFIMIGGQQFVVETIQRLYKCEQKLIMISFWCESIVKSAFFKNWCTVPELEINNFKGFFFLNLCLLMFVLKWISAWFSWQNVFVHRSTVGFCHAAAAIDVHCSWKFIQVNQHWSRGN